MSRKETALKTRYDVVIVGSGPAGAATARTLSGHGLDVLIMEKNRIPRHKMCSGILFPSAVKLILENHGDIPDKVYSHPIDIKGTRAYLTTESPVLEWPFTMRGRPVNGINAKRAELDDWLCRSSNAEIVDQCRFKGFEEHDKIIKVKAERNNKVVEFVTNYLVGADGTLSRVRRSLFPDWDHGLELLPNYEEWYLGEIDLEPHWLYQFFDRRLTGFFACVFQKDNSIVVTTGCKSLNSVRDYFRDFVKYLKESHGFIVRQKTASYACVLHDMSARDNFILGRGNLLLVGEAGGFNRCAEGITSALVTGNTAGESILKGMETGQPSLGLYSEAVAPEIEKCKKASRIVEQLVGINPFTRD